MPASGVGHSDPFSVSVACSSAVSTARQARFLAVRDGTLGFRAASRNVFPTTQEQQWWVHKTAKVLDYLPRGKQGKAKKMLPEIRMGETGSNAHKAFVLFLETYSTKYPKAAECLAKDRDVLLTFHDFPAEPGAMSGRRTRSNQRLPPFGFGCAERKLVDRALPP
jgi:hypothetical protein